MTAACDCGVPLCLFATERPPVTDRTVDRLHEEAAGEDEERTRRQAGRQQARRKETP